MTDPELRLLAPWALARQGRIDEATNLTLKLIDDAEEDRGSEWNFVHYVLNVTSAIARVDREKTRLLLNRLRSWFAASGCEFRVLRGPLAARWAILCSLDELDEDLPIEVREGIAIAAGPNRLDDAAVPLRQFAQRSPKAAKRIRKRLKKVAPALNRAIGDWLEPMPSSSPSRQPRIQYVVLLVFATGLYRSLVRDDRHEQPVQNQRAVVTASLSSSARESIDDLLSRAKSVRAGTVVSSLRRLEEALPLAPCAELHSSFDAFERSSDELQAADPNFRRRAKELSTMVRMRCPNTAESGEEN
jgi:hypothetical protein